MPLVKICPSQIQEIVDAISNSASTDYTQLLTDILTGVQAVDANTDNVETLITDSITELQTANISLSAMITLLNQIDALLQNIDANTDDVETLIQTQTTLLQTEFDETQAILTNILNKPETVLIDVCFGDGCSGYATATIDATGTITILKTYDSSLVENTGAIIAPCCECNVIGCLLVSGFDAADEGAWVAGDFNEFEIVDSSGTTVVTHDYLTTTDGVNKSSWYIPVITTINALPNWSVSIENDAGINSNDKVQYRFEYSGPGNETLSIYKGSVGQPSSSKDRLDLVVDATGNVTGVSDSWGSGTPFGSSPFNACP